MISIICQNCGKTFESEEWAKRKFCSHNCAQRSQRKRIGVKCKKCGKAFEARPSEIKAGRGVYCSKECAFNAMSKGVENKTKTCKECGLKQVGKHRLNSNAKTFTCRNCRQKKHYKRVKRCTVCGRTFIPKKYRTKTTGGFCSKTCREIFFGDGGRKSLYCAVCGLKLDGSTKTHGHETWSVCDTCFYIRRKAYKLRAKMGGGDIEKASFSLAIIDGINFFNSTRESKGKTQWERQVKSLRRAAEKLRLTT